MQYAMERRKPIAYMSETKLLNYYKCIERKREEDNKAESLYLCMHPGLIIKANPAREESEAANDKLQIEGLKQKKTKVQTEQ